MQKTTALILLVCTWVLWPGYMQADDVVDAAVCLKPSRPDFQLQSEYADFRQAVRAYEQCINNYIDEQEQSAEEHLNAAVKAREEWRRFVSSELR